MGKWIIGVSRLKWLILIAWILLATFSFFLLPDLQAITHKTEQRFLPTDTESVRATRLIQQIDPSARSLSNAVIALSRKEGLKETDKEWMKSVVAQIESSKTELGITSLLSAQTQPELAERLLSKDGTTLLAIVNLPKADFEEETRITLIKLKQLLAHTPNGASAVLTGSAPLSQDFQQSSQAGLHRTELLTIGLVLLILLLVFRSPITPVIPLLTIGISFVISRGLIAWAAAYGLPVSHFSESFLIAVLFGVGTDYCILMIQRYREELFSGADGDQEAAISRMMTGVRRTIIYSSLAVFIAFLLISLADFGLYRSAAGVAIGMLVTVSAALTLAPAMLLLLGKSLFWPLRIVSVDYLQRGYSRFWAVLASLTARRSGIVLLAGVLFLAPLTLLFHGKRSFDDVSEINPELGSVSGFRQVEQAFGAGEVFPVTFAVIAKQSMRTTSGLAALEQASSDLTQIEGVMEVRSAVRPLGHKPEELTVPGQLRRPDSGAIIRSLMEQQKALIAGLQAVALGAVPLSQGLVGVWPAIQHLQAGLGQFILTQLHRLHNNGTQPTEPKEEPSNSKRNSIDSQRVLDFYISPDGKITKFELILKDNPYSTDAIDNVQMITQKLRESLSATALAESEVFATGVSAKYNELRHISYADFIRVGLLILISIAVILILLLRSILPPLYILVSLVLNYLITMGLLEFLFVKVLGFTGLSWTVSFFIFLIVVALGVDYSIFLMARFKEEYRSGDVVPAMTKALSTTGSIIGSAAVIMAGTFGALGFSGVDTLIQIGIGTLIGLLLYATLFMALIVPSFTIFLGEANWWPNRKQTRKSNR